MAKKRKPKKLQSSQPPDSAVVSIKPGTPEWEAAEKVAASYQDNITVIRDARTTVGYKLSDRWNEWHNNMMTVCFGLGGALIALITTIHFKTSVNRILFAAGASALIIDGLYILMSQKRRLERESLQALGMGYEMEYYSMVIRNRVQDTLRGQPFNFKEYDEAKNKLLDDALSGIDASYEESRTVDSRTDVIVTILIASLCLFGLSSIPNQSWLLIASMTALVFLIALLLYFRHTVLDVKESLGSRDKWLEKLKEERTRNI